MSMAVPKSRLNTSEPALIILESVSISSFLTNPNLLSPFAMYFT